MNKILPFVISDTPLDTLEAIINDTISHPDGVKILAKLILDATYCDINESMHNSGIMNLNPRIKAIPIPSEINQIWIEKEELTGIPSGLQIPSPPIC